MASIKISTVNTREALMTARRQTAFVSSRFDEARNVPRLEVRKAPPVLIDGLETEAYSTGWSLTSSQASGNVCFESSRAERRSSTMLDMLPSAARAKHFRKSEKSQYRRKKTFDG